MQVNKLFHADYNSELFAGIYLHPKQKDYPTILFFRTGSYTMMGGKQKLILEECVVFAKKLIQLFDRQCNSMHGEISGASEL